MGKTPPPSIRKEFCEIVKFGDKRTDPYFWLRDSHWREVLQDAASLAPEIRKHLDAENEYFNAATKEFSVLSDAVRAEIKGRLSVRDDSVPERDGDFEYWFQYRPAGNYHVYKQKNITTGVERIVFDGDQEGAGKKFFDVTAFVYGPGHELAAYAVDDQGAGNFSLKFRDVKTGLDLPETIEGVKGQVIWSPDGSCVYYTAGDDRHISKSVKCHVIGTNPAEDAVVYEEQDSRCSLAIRQSQSGEYLFIESLQGEAVTVETRFLPLGSGAGTSSELISPASPGHDYHVEHRDADFYIRTNTDGAVNFKIMRTPVATPGREHWVDAVSYDAGAFITDVIAFKDFLVRRELCDALPRIVVSDYQGNEYIVPFSGAAFNLGLDPDDDFSAEHLLVEYQAPANPGEVYDLDLRSGKKTLVEKTQLPGGFNPDDYIVERKFIKSRDGVSEVPVTLLRHKSTKTDGSAPLYLQGYGAYGSEMPADFSSPALSLVDRGVIYAIAHVHGGDEKGRDWYLNGRGDHKWNTFHDFIDAAEGLTDLGYGEKGKIVIEGCSAGGLLMGVVLNERPDLFAGAIVGVAFLDVMNTMSDPSLPWVEEEKAEWGDPNDEEIYHYQRSYSPYDNIKPGVKYPPILATTGLSDPLVMYWEPAKWIARLRDEAQGGPFYLKVNANGGHQGASARLERIDDDAVEIGFALQQFEKCGYDLALKTAPVVKPAKNKIKPPQP